MLDEEIEEFWIALAFPGLALAIQAVRIEYLGFGANQFGDCRECHCCFGVWNDACIMRLLKLESVGRRIGIVVLATVYGVGFAFAGNSVMDRLLEERYPYEAGFKTRVGGKYLVERVGLRRVDLRAPFLPSVQVSPVNYSRIQTGDRIEIVIHRGWLGLDWYTADSRAK